MTQSVEMWNAVYDDESAPWLIGEPQPEIVELARSGEISGSVLDVGCGAGEHTILLADAGHDVVGVDLSPSAIAYAQANAERRGVAARFEVADALHLPGEQRFDTIVDSALFHVFAHDNGDPTAYVRSLRAVCKPNGLVYVLALSDVDPGFGPTIPESAIRDAFAAGWTVERLRQARYRGRITEHVAEVGAALGVPIGSTVDRPAWLARIRRTD
ncbi:MAG: class I SAM-dependent methyltransferase [Mycobacteriaceae bacterium]|nr:class I SAM-dependent methyltransferase [Mycobacteriaceae bacterium]